jgi:hypothetical protein
VTVGVEHFPTMLERFDTLSLIMIMRRNALTVLGLIRIRRDVSAR